MRRALIVAVVVLLASQAAAANGGWPWSHTRWSGETGRRLLAEAAGRSALLRGILSDLDRTDVIVFVTASMSGTGNAGAAAHLSFISAAGKVRYLHVEVDTLRAGEWDAIPLLGHELQHALEVAAAPDVRDARSFERLYYRIGWQSGRGTYETDLARATGRRIQAEMRWAKATPDGGHDPR